MGKITFNNVQDTRQPQEEYSINSVIDFGIYHAAPKTVKEILVENPKYIDWCARSKSGFRLDRYAKHKLDEALEDLANKYNDDRAGECGYDDMRGSFHDQISKD